MAMSSSVLSTALRAAMLADTAIGAVDGPALTALCDAIAETVVAHITTLAVVTVPVGVAVQVAYPAGTGATIAPGVGTIS